MRLALLTFLRSSELRGGMWSEVDVDAREWRNPPTRMKMGKGSHQAHVVPLSDEALAVIEELRELTGSGPAMFPSAYGGEGGIMSENTIGRTLIRMGYQGRQSLHGFRASGRSLLSERGWSAAPPWAQFYFGADRRASGRPFRPRPMWRACASAKTSA